MSASLKSIVAKHFDYTPNQGSYFHGEWFSPKHKDSLSDLLEEIHGGVESDEKEELDELKEEVLGCEKEISEKEARIEELEEKVADLEEKLNLARRIV